MSQKPTVGRTVHYHSYGSPGGEFKPMPRAAIITEVFSDEEVQVFVMNPTGLFFNRVSYSEGPKPGCWSWPPRAPAAPHPGLPTSGPPAWCKVCPHPVGLHNPDGSCGCGMDCAAQSRLTKKED